MKEIKKYDEAVKYRRSVRHFTDQKLDTEVVKACIQEATLAPSSSNMQLWEFHHITSSEVLEKMKPICFDQNTVKTAQQMIVIVVRKDLARSRAKYNMEALYKEYGKTESSQLTKREKGNIDYYKKLMPFLYGDFLGIIGRVKWLITRCVGLFKMTYRQVTAADMRIVCHKSAALAAQTLMLGLAARNIDTCPMEGIDTLRVKKLLGLPRASEINMVLTLGYRREDGIYYSRLRVPFEEVYTEH